MSRATRLLAMRARQQRHKDALARDDAIRARYAHDPVWVLAVRAGRSENFVRRIGVSR